MKPPTNLATSSISGTVDCHAHLLPRAYTEMLAARSAVDPALLGAAGRIEQGHDRKYPLLFGDLQRRVEMMDDANIAEQILSMGSPYVYPSVPSIRTELTTTWNDETENAIRPFADRFWIFASVPLPDVDAALHEAKRVSGRDSHAGFMMHTNVEGEGIDSPKWWPLYDYWNSLQSVVFLHPDGFCVPNLLKDYEMNWDIGTQFDDVIAVVRLYSSGVLSRFPGIRWIVPHLGGAIPFLLGRLDEHWERDQKTRNLKAHPSKSLSGMYFDTAGHNGASISFAVETLGDDQVVCGSDFPMVGGDDLRPLIAKVEDSLTVAAANRILRDNILGILPRRMAK